MSEEMFTERVRDVAPLRDLLETWARIPRTFVEGFDPGGFVDTTDEEIWKRAVAGSELSAARVEVRQTEPMPEPLRHPRAGSDGTTIEHWRWRVEVGLAGRTDMLRYWPARMDGRPLGGVSDGLPAPAVWWQYWGGNAYAYFDVPVADDSIPDFPTDRLRAAAEYVRAAASAANAEVETFVADLRVECLAILAERRSRLTVWGEQIGEALELVRLDRGPLEVVRPTVPDEGRPSHPVSPEAAGRGTSRLWTTGGAPHPEVDLPHSVTGRTFGDLVASIRQWGAAVERYPESFGRMPEEAISGVLVATLNAVFDTAQREVFQAKGRTDFLVEVVRGQRENAAYFGEAKVWGGPARVRQHLGQLLSYANAATRQVVLLYYVRNINIGPVAGAAAAAIEAARPPFLTWIQRDADGLVALVRHPEMATEIEVTVLFVHAPRSAKVPSDP